MGGHIVIVAVASVTRSDLAQVAQIIIYPCVHLVRVIMIFCHAWTFFLFKFVPPIPSLLEHLKGPKTLVP